MKSLKSRTFVAVAWTLGGQLIRNGTGLITSIFLARLLGPEEFGLVGMAMAFIVISEVFYDVGFSSGLIQSQNNTNLTYSSVFYFNAFAGLALTGLFYFLAPLLGMFYGNEEIVSLARWLSLVFVLNSGSLVQIAILKKSLDFRKITIRTTISAAIGGVFGVSTALLGFGVYSLVVQTLTGAFISTVLLWSITDWRPDWKFSRAELRKLAGFSTYIFLERILSSVFQRLDVLLIGKFFSPVILGFYARAASLKDVVRKYSSSSVIKVFYPVLSEVQNDKLRFQAIYYKLISVLAFISFGLTGLMFVLGRDFIIIVFGQKWEDSVAIFQVIILSVTNYPVNALMVNAFLSQGKSKENFYLGLIRKVLRTVPFAFAYFYGLREFTIALVGFNYLLTFVNIFYMSKYVDLKISTHIKKLMESTLPVALLIWVYYFFGFDGLSILARLGLAASFVVIYLLYNGVTRNEGFSFALENVSKLKHKMKRGWA